MITVVVVLLLFYTDIVRLLRVSWLLDQYACIATAWRRPQYSETASARYGRTTAASALVHSVHWFSTFVALSVDVLGSLKRTVVLLQVVTFVLLK